MFWRQVIGYVFSHISNISPQSLASLFILLTAFFHREKEFCILAKSNIFTVFFPMIKITEFLGGQGQERGGD